VAERIRKRLTRKQIISQLRRVIEPLDREIAADPHWRVHGDAPGDFLYALRPSGAKLPALFAGIPEAAGVLERLQTVFAHAGPETGHMYFMVSRPARLTDAALTKKLHTWASTVAGMIDVANLVDAADVPMIHRLVSKPPVEIVAGPPGEGSSHPLLALIHEAIVDYKDNVDYPPVAEILMEALYTIACRYDLAHWILRPSLGKVASDADDLFAPVAALWLAGVEFAYIGEGADLRIHAWRTVSGKPAAPRSARPRSGSAPTRAKRAASPSGSGRKR